jgi:hypothetical protein
MTGVSGAPPLHVAYLISRYPAISHAFILREVRSLRKLGICVQVASINPPDRSEAHLTAEERDEAMATFSVKSAGLRGVLVPHLATLIWQPLAYLKGVLFALRLGGADLSKLVFGLFYFVEAVIIGRWMTVRGLSHLHVHFATPAALVALLASRIFPITFSIPPAPLGICGPFAAGRDAMSRDTLALLGGFVSMLLAAATLPGTIELLLLTTGGLLRGARWRLGDGSGVMHTRGHAGAAIEITTPFRLAVVVPAHNEEAVIQRRLQSLYACDKTAAEVVVVVVANNCSDRTAERAAETGARVLVRCEPEKRGKGYALAFAFDVLHLEGFNAVLVVDADTRRRAESDRRILLPIRYGCRRRAVSLWC